MEGRTTKGCRRHYRKLLRLIKDAVEKHNVISMGLHGNPPAATSEKENLIQLIVEGWFCLHMILHSVEQMESGEFATL